MNINPKITEEIAKVSIDLTGKAKELAFKSEIGNNLRYETPKGVSGNYFHPDLIKDKEFDVKKAIEDFHDINDTETIAKICHCWRDEYTKLLEDFTPEKIAKMEDPKATHQAAIKAIENIYGRFTDKISQMHNNPQTVEKVTEVFATHIEPITHLSMETYSKIDRISAMSHAYTKDSIAAELKEKISKCTMFEDIPSLITEVEKIKEIDPKEYERLNKIIEKKLEEFAQKSSSETSDTTEEVKKIASKSVMNYSKMSADDLHKEIEKMTAEEIISGEKVGKIYDALDKMHRAGDEAYIPLKIVFDKKLTDLAGVL